MCVVSCDLQADLSQEHLYTFWDAMGKILTNNRKGNIVNIGAYLKKFYSPLIVYVYTEKNKNDNK